MKCKNHPDREATWICQKFNYGYCDECCQCTMPDEFCRFRANHLCPINEICLPERRYEQKKKQKKERIKLE